MPHGSGPVAGQFDECRVAFQNDFQRCHQLLFEERSAAPVVGQRRHDRDVEKLVGMTSEEANRRLSLPPPAGCRNSFSSCNDGKATSDDLNRKDWDGSSPQAGPAAAPPHLSPPPPGGRSQLDADWGSPLNAFPQRSSMPIPTSRSELLDAIEGNFAKLFKDLETVPAARCHETTLEGNAKGTMMNVQNLVNYLVGWNHLVLKWIDLDSRGDAIDFPETGFQWNQLGALTQKFYSNYEDIPFDQLLMEFEDSKQRIVMFISSLSAISSHSGKCWHTRRHSHH